MTTDVSPPTGGGHQAPAASELQAGIAVVLAGAGDHHRRTGRPLVTLSYAQSLDGCLAAEPGQPLRLSGPAALRLTHWLRAQHAAILVGIGTVLADDPLLSVRMVDGAHPQPVVVDSHLRLPLTARLLVEAPRRPWIATRLAAPVARQIALQAAGARLLHLPSDAAGHLDLAALLDQLGALGLTSLMVEGGARIITSLLNARLADQLIVTLAPRLVGGAVALGRLGAGLTAPPRLAAVGYFRLGSDLIVRGDLDWSSSS